MRELSCILLQKQGVTSTRPLMVLEMRWPGTEISLTPPEARGLDCLPPMVFEMRLNVHVCGQC